ncbi:MAG TPA: stage III sporulation protein AF [Candidatus Mediterraneibacter quadrami]|uniref:Stage III sporulation protein AF n=1 Tax=Candidatus Mediterraneibacter quadrami TaxID=2838684 RepID=A0A9D2RFT6_9FIRM|nr:stage III sporulation protein AF [Candidatus Mediterraneibacter quadrami]
MDMIGAWIRDIAVFLIVSAAVLHAVPGKSYRKYIRFFTGLILILLLAEPVLELSGMARRFEAICHQSMIREEAASGDGIFE